MGTVSREVEGDNCSVFNQIRRPTFRSSSQPLALLSMEQSAAKSNLCTRNFSNARGKGSFGTMRDAERGQVERNETSADLAGTLECSGVFRRIRF